MPVDRVGSVIVAVEDTFYVIGGGHNIFNRDSMIAIWYKPFTNTVDE